MVLAVPEEHEAAVLKSLKDSGEKAVTIGEVRADENEAIRFE